MEQIVFGTEKDIPHIIHLMHTSVGTTTPKDWYVTDDEDFVRRHLGEAQVLFEKEHPATAQSNTLGAQKQKPEGYTLIYIIDNQPVAFLIVRHPGEAEDNLGRYLSVPLHLIAHMESVAVHPDYRGKGLQGKLMQRAEAIERAGGTSFLMATVHPENRYSLHNLEAAGYQCILETKKYGGLRRKVMCKAL